MPSRCSDAPPRPVDDPALASDLEDLLASAAYCLRRRWTSYDDMSEVCERWSLSKFSRPFNCCMLSPSDHGVVGAASSCECESRSFLSG